MGRMGRPLVMTADERKAVIFTAAEKLFGARGYEKVTMAEIAAEAGMSKRTLYLLFPDKGELLRALMASSYIWPENVFTTEEPDPVEALRLRLIVTADHVLSDRHVRLCRLAISESNGQQGVADAFLEMGIGTSRGHLIRAIETIPKARRKLDLPAPILANMLFGALCGFRLMQALLSDRIPDRGDLVGDIELVMVQTFT